jgi:Ni/Co efflux regulator RcnB
MNRIGKLVALSTLSAVLSTGAIFAQDNHDDRNDHPGSQSYVRHDEWKKGARISHDDWNRGAAVDYHSNHLKAPPRGYEWRQVDGNYVLAAAATGLIASAIIASAAH